MSKEYKTIIEVRRAPTTGKKRWIITRCDQDTSVVGFPTDCGVPWRAENVPEGSTFVTIFTVK